MGIWSVIPSPGYFFGHEDMGYFDLMMMALLF